MSLPSPPLTKPPCPKCGRPLASAAKRCVYCGHARNLAPPGTPEYETERAALEADAKRIERQKVVFTHGMGLGKTAAKPSLSERLRRQSFPVQLIVMAVVVPLLMFVAPVKAFKMAKEVFRP